MVKKWLRFITELVFASSQAPQRQAAAKPGRMGLLEGNKKVNAADSELIKGASVLLAERS